MPASIDALHLLQKSWDKQKLLVQAMALPGLHTSRLRKTSQPPSGKATNTCRENLHHP